ncbi:aldo/keto reductase [Streptomyces sp. NBC_00576]|uniref:aldo/keto reductase n=1 Tax=Streptomyces sp. NBC_00576 TaxID=2903665 RepID=UPI002E8120CC|nr:aldo/keto reductase [Streptomyces sp. NBC_00576]WUB72086.1 aldo/keto reductase [Streptomyces sp. NBC_00576]
MNVPDTLPTTRLGVDGPPVGAQGLGCMGMSEFYGPSDRKECLKTLERALELGVTLYDTADNYGHGQNERLLAPFVRAHRDRVLVSTKFGLVRRADDPHYRGIDNSPGYLRTAVEGSLRRLGTDTIDLCIAHRLDPRTPVEDTVAEMAKLVDEGKVRLLGLSEVTGEELLRANRVHPIAAVQSEWSLFSREVEADVVPVAAELGVALMAYSPLGRGFLAGGFTSADQLSANDYRRTMPRFTGENAQRNTAILAPLHRIAAAGGATAAQVALAWLHHRSAVHGLPVVPIPGTRSPARVEENTAAATLVLGADELAALEPMAAQVSGSRLIGLNFTPQSESDRSGCPA